MKILLVTGDLFFGEPIGIMTIATVCMNNGDNVKLIAIKKHNIEKDLESFDPDIIAYSTMSPEVQLFIQADKIIKNWIEKRNKNVFRIMGGPHPTHFPEVLEQMKLDAICIGEGDNAIISVINAIKNHNKIADIPNILPYGESVENMQKELVADLDKFPFLNRDAYYQAVPLFRKLAMRSIMIGRGCPYHCTYCHNHAFNKLFSGCGKILRRKSVDYVIEELKFTIKNYPPVRLIKFSDDTFAHTIDDWLIDFLTKYKNKIRLPFYCLMRSNTLTEEMAKLLSKHGCIAIMMSVESGNEEVRNNILKRNISDKLCIDSFAFAHKYGMTTYGNTLLALPGGTFKHDYDSFLFARRIKITAPTFGVFNPYPRTDLTQYAMDNGYLDKDYDFSNQYGNRSPLNNYSELEKDMQINMCYLAPIFCALPDCFLPLFNFLIRLKPNKITRTLGSSYMVAKVGKYIFPNIYPKNVISYLSLLVAAIRFFFPPKNVLKSTDIAP